MGKDVKEKAVLLVALTHLYLVAKPSVSNHKPPNWKCQNQLKPMKWQTKSIRFVGLFSSKL